MRRAHSRIPVLVMLMAVAVACVYIEEPQAPDIEVDPDYDGCTLDCECDAESVQGRAYRITRLEIDEPEELSAILNGMWASEIEYHTLNVLFTLNAAEPETTPFTSLSLSAGPGWREPEEPYAIEPGGTEVTSYYMLDTLSAALELERYRGYPCHFKSADTSSLYFHLGPESDPLVCAPLLAPQNATPIRELKVRFSFNEDCTAIRDGYLEGCITEEDANRICMCISAGSCERPVDPGATFDPDDPTGYCASACGSGWLSFGAILTSSLPAPTCITADGQVGYRLQAFFDAEDVSDKYSVTGPGT